MTLVKKIVLWSVAVCVFGFIGAFFLIAIWVVYDTELIISSDEGVPPRNVEVVKIADVAAAPVQSKPLAGGGMASAGMSDGSMLGGGMMGGGEASQSAIFQQRIDAAVKTLREAQSDEDKRVAKDALRKVLSDIFTQDMQAREKQAQEIETRLAKLRLQFEAREKVKDEIIDLQLQVLERDAAGLGFPDVSASSHTSDFVPPLAGPPAAQGGQNTPAAGGEGASFRRTHPPTLPQAVELKTAHATPTQMHHFTSGADVKSIAYSADGDRIAIANGSPTLILQTDGSSRVEDDWKPSVEILNAETGKTIVSLKLTSEAEDAILAATERVSHFEVTALAFSPDWDLLAVGTSIGQVKLFNARIGELVQTLDDEQPRLADKATPENWKSLKRAMGTVASLAFSPDGSQLAMCGESFSDFSDVFDGIRRLGRSVTGPGRLKVWKVEPRSSKYDLAYDLAGHSQANAVAFSSLGNLLASAGRWESGHDRGTGVIIWNPVTGERIRSITTEANGDTHAVAFSPNDQSIAIGSVNFDKDKGRDAATGTVTLTRVGSGILVWHSSFSGWVKPLAFSPNGDRESVVVLCGGQSIRLLDTETGTVTHEVQAADFSPGERWNDFATAPQRHMLAVGGIDAEKRGFVTTWDMGQRSRRRP